MPQELAPDLAKRIADSFAEQVTEHAHLPFDRTEDFRGSCNVAVLDDGALLRITCTITGSSYESPWDGHEESALALAAEAAESTVDLVTTTRHYGWLRSRT
jgi:hypothetical protein